MKFGDGYRKASSTLANPTNVIIVFAIITVFGLGITISFVNFNFHQNEQTQIALQNGQSQIINLTNQVLNLTNQIKHQEQTIHEADVHNAIENAILLKTILNHTESNHTG